MPIEIFGKIGKFGVSRVKPNSSSAHFVEPRPLEFEFATGLIKALAVKLLHDCLPSKLGKSIFEVAIQLKVIFFIIFSEIIAVWSHT